VRGIIATGWGGLNPEFLPDSIFTIENAPHDWLFPQVSAVLHHGGAGTTAAGLRAGVPSILIPHFADQPFWGRQVVRLGVGTQPIPRNKLTADKLTRAIQEAVSDQSMQEKARQLGENIRAENGITNAVSAIQKILAEY